MSALRSIAAGTTSSACGAQFPILVAPDQRASARLSRQRRLDAAAAAVIDAVEHYETHLHANVHRGVHTLSQLATDAFEVGA